MFSALVRATALLHSLCRNKILWRIWFSLPNSPSCSSSEWLREEKTGRRKGRAWVAVLWVFSSVFLGNTFCASPIWEELASITIHFIFVPSQIIDLNKTECHQLLMVHAKIFFFVSFEFTNAPFLWLVSVWVGVFFPLMIKRKKLYRLCFLRLDIYYFYTPIMTLHIHLCS